MGIKIGGQIEKLNGKQLSYNEFVDKYVANNQPVVLTGLMDDWSACKDWVTVKGQPNLHFFATHYGKSVVQVADCGIREFTDQKRIEMNVSEFIEHWLEGNSECLLYLKDWHFVKEYPGCEAYKTPLFFHDDWLNLYLDHYVLHKDPDAYPESNDVCCSDYRFVYMGAKGTWTPLHADVFRSYSWSANVCGKKKWLFLSPSQSHLVFDRNLKSSVYNIFDDVSEIIFPGFKEAIWMECTQEPNEIIFVPSGWYHQVHNMEDTISINHNWFNGYNLCWVWELLFRDYKEAREYIEDIRDICDDFEGLCQRNLAANTGMNFLDFFIFLSHFFLANMFLVYCQHRDNGISFQTSSQLAQLLAFNVVSIQIIASKMKSIDDLAGTLLDLRETYNDPHFLELCIDLGRTYGMMYEQKNWGHDISKALMVEFLDYRSPIRTPEDFLKFIDHAVSKLSETCCLKSILLSKLNGLSI